MDNDVDINVKIEEITFIKLIGFGTFSDVYSAKCPNKCGDKTIAVKKLRPLLDSNKKLERELKTLSSFKHPNIVTFYGISKDHENKFLILLEYAECGSLSNFLHIKKHETNSIPDIYKLFWMIQCATGIAYLHEKNIMHRDLKSDNILLFDNYRMLKLCDFGTVKVIATTNTANIGTAYYMAPEVAKDGKYDAKCDVYSFGIIFWEVMSLKKPFYDLDEISPVPPVTLQNFVAKGHRPPVSDIQIFNNSEKMLGLIEQCWHGESKKRPTIQQVLQILKSFFEHNDSKDPNLMLQVPSMIFKGRWKDILQIPTFIQQLLLKRTEQNVGVPAIMELKTIGGKKEQNDKK